MDKEISKKIFLKNKIKTPKFFTYSYDYNKINVIKKINKKLGFPVVVKPLNEGYVKCLYYRQKLSKTLAKLNSYKKF